MYVSEHDGILKDVEYGLIYLYILGHIRCSEALFWMMMNLEKNYIERFVASWTEYVSEQFINNMDWGVFYTAHKSDNQKNMNNLDFLWIRSMNSVDLDLERREI